MEKICGLPGASGLAALPARVLNRQTIIPVPREPENVDCEAERLHAVCQQYARELDTLSSRAQGDAAQILQACAAIVRDRSFFRKVEKQIRTGHTCADWALHCQRDLVCKRFESMEDPYLRERAADISGVCDEIIRRLNGTTGTISVTGSQPVILVAEELTPEDTVRIDKSLLGGFVTERGGITSHAVILAKTLGIPAVVGAAGIVDAVKNGDELCVDGTAGTVLVRPTEEERARFLAAEADLAARKACWEQALLQPAVTTDGHSVRVCINSGDTDSLRSFSPRSCDGIGLFRTEFLFMDQTDYPDEQFQYTHYREAAEKAEGREVIIRTLDIGGDKQLDYMNMPKESNPFLGYRAIRLCLDRQDLFLTQLRAILRASVYGKLRIMFPMIVTSEELLEAKKLVRTAMAQLDAEHIPYDPDIPVGIMVETPAAVLLSDVLAKQCDFFSIGTNDLIQYTTATDRQNAHVQYLYTPCNLSVLRAIQMTIRSGHAAGIPVGMCGEAASDPLLLPLLLGMGLDEFSVVPAQLGRVKYCIQHASFRQLQALDAMLGTQSSIDQWKAQLEAFRLPEGTPARI